MKRFNLSYFNVYDPKRTAPYITDFFKTPVEAGAYILDKIELAALVINIGVRFDYLNQQAPYRTDPLDPTSVVRESEYARSGQNQALMDRMLGAATKLAKGGAGVTPAALKNFLDSAEAMYAGVKQYRSRVRDRISRTAQRYGLPEDEIFPDEVETDEAPAGGPAAGYANPATVRRK